jgi:anti-anti-sigma regulatory factor
MDNPTYALPAAINTANVVELRNALAERRGAPLGIDASAVERIGGLGLQLLLSASRTWSGDGQVFSILNPSQAFTEMLRLTGAANLPELAS